MSIFYSPTRFSNTLFRFGGFLLSPWSVHCNVHLMGTLHYTQHLLLISQKTGVVLAKKWGAPGAVQENLCDMKKALSQCDKLKITSNKYRCEYVHNLAKLECLYEFECSIVENISLKEKAEPKRWPEFTRTSQQETSL